MSSGSVVLRGVRIGAIVISGIFIPLLILVLLPYLLAYKQRRAILKIPGPPLPKSWLSAFFLGHTAFFPAKIEDQLEYFLQKAVPFEEVGYYSFLMGPISLLHINGPRAAREIMASSKHSLKNTFYDMFLPWLGTGLLLSSGQKWRSRRRLITPTFHFDVLRRFLDVMNEQVDVMLANLGKIADGPSREEAFDVYRLITACTLDIICETAMGKKVHAQKEEGRLSYVDAVFKMSDIVNYRIQHPWFFNDFLFSLTAKGKENGKTLKQLHDFTDGVIRERKALLEQGQQDHSRLAFLDILLTSEVDGEHLSSEDIREEVDTFMFEGHDTTSASIAWTFQLVGSHPEVQRKLQEEIDAVMGESENLTTEMLGELKYMEKVLKESLRLYPAVPFIGRRTTEDLVLDGHFIPKGTEVGIQVIEIHHNSTLWKNPKKFDPERWENWDSEGHDPYSYIPFSAGPRNCIGQKFAQNEEKVILSKVLKNFTIESAVANPKAYSQIVLKPNDGILIKVTRR